MLLKLYNTLTKKSYEFMVNDTGNSNINYKINLRLESGMDEGTYEFKLYDNNKLVSRGLAQIGDYVPQTTSYTKTEDGYIQYNS